MKVYLFHRINLNKNQYLNHIKIYEAFSKWNTCFVVHDFFKGKKKLKIVYKINHGNLISSPECVSVFEQCFTYITFGSSVWCERRSVSDAVFVWYVYQNDHFNLFQVYVFSCYKYISEINCTSICMFVCIYRRVNINDKANGQFTLHWLLLWTNVKICVAGYRGLVFFRRKGWNQCFHR